MNLWIVTSLLSSALVHVIHLVHPPPVIIQTLWEAPISGKLRIHLLHLLRLLNIAFLRLTGQLITQKFGNPNHLQCLRINFLVTNQRFSIRLHLLNTLELESLPWGQCHDQCWRQRFKHLRMRGRDLDFLDLWVLMLLGMCKNKFFVKM